MGGPTAYGYDFKAFHKACPVAATSIVAEILVAGSEEIFHFLKEQIWEYLHIRELGGTRMS